ncbi:MAG: STAS domain-containing protein [Isosphaeraceae bacterium]
MSNVEFQHIKTNMVGEVAVAEVLTKELRFPPQAKELGQELELVAGQDWARQFLVNMHRVKYFSSTGFAILFTLVKHARDRSTTVKFCALHPEVRIGAEIIGLDKLAEIHDTEEEALKSFST